MNVGDLLLPNSYLIANKNPLTGIVLEIIDDIWGKNYKVLLSNGIVHWMDTDKINGLFVVEKL